MNFWEQICWALSDKMSFEVFPPNGPMLKKTKKKNSKKKKMQNFEKGKKVVWRYGAKVLFHRIWH